MSSWPFRFVHAGDFRLDQVPWGVTEVPEPLRETFLEATYLAAERVFETVLGEEADFLVLSGNLLAPHLTGARGPLFLVQQFQRLAQRNVPVYWAAGELDPPEAWPAWLKLPENVVVFPRGAVEEHVLHHADAPLVRVVGTSGDAAVPLRPGLFAPDPTGVYTVVAATGEADASELQARGIHYWALGGRLASATLYDSPGLACYAGSPQGRHPGDSGPHGCTVVHVDEQGVSRLVPTPTDILRWVRPTIELPPKATRVELQTMLAERIQALCETNPGVDLLISWTVVGTGNLIRRMRRGELDDELLLWLRSEYGFGPPVAWSVELNAQPPEVLPSEWFQQESIRSDFLRAVRELQRDPALPLDVSPYLDRERLEPALVEAAMLVDPSDRQQALRGAALLGVDLLSGEEPQS